MSTLNAENSDKQLSISLVSYNQLADVQRLLPSLLPAARFAQAEILLVDNYCQDGVASFVHENFPEVNVIVNDQRAGYGENHNLNLQRARGKYFLIMNTDMVILQEDSLQQLRLYMDQNPTAGILTAKVINVDGTIQGLNKRYPTLLDLFLRRALPKSLHHLVQKRLDYYEMRDVGYDQPCDVNFVSGAFMFCRTDMLRAIDGFDPAYFLYFEDVDLCRRAQKTHRTAYYPGVSIVHYWQRAAHSSWRHNRYFLESAFRYFNRWGYKLF